LLIGFPPPVLQHRAASAHRQFRNRAPNLSRDHRSLDHAAINESFKIRAKLREIFGSVRGRIALQRSINNFRRQRRIEIGRCTPAQPAPADHRPSRIGTKQFT
jgi:hypothetical protein